MASSSDESIRASMMMSVAALEIYEPVTPLRQMALYVIAMELWRARLHNTTQVIVRTCDLSNDEYEAIVKELPAPDEIKKTIKRCFKRFGNQMEEWGNRLKRVEMGPYIRYPKADLVCCVWNSNGIIDERKSAVNLISNATSSFDKLLIASKFCMEDEIKKLPIDISIPSEYADESDFPLLYYWLRYMKGDHGQSSAAAIIRNENVNMWPAIEYLWDRLSVIEQTELVPELSGYCRSVYHTLRFLLKMNVAQKQVAFETSLEDTIRWLWYIEAHRPIALHIFTSLRTFIADSKFSVMFAGLLGVFIDEEIVEMDSLLEVWNLSPDHLKENYRESFSSSDFESYFPKDTKYYKRFVNGYKGSFDFLWALLSSSSPEFRKKLILNRDDKTIFLYSSFPVLDQLFRLCLPKAEDMAKFRRTFAKDMIVVSNMDDCIIYRGDGPNLVKFIARYFSDPEDMTMFRKAVRRTVNKQCMEEVFDAAAEAAKNGERSLDRYCYKKYEHG